MMTSSGSGATPTATEGRKKTTDLIQDTPEEDQQTGHMDTQNSSDEDDNNQSIVNDAEDNVSNRDCTRGHNEDKEQEEGITLSLAKNQEDLAAAKKHTQHGQTAKIPSQQSETRPAVKENLKLLRGTWIKAVSPERQKVTAKPTDRTGSPKKQM